MLVKATKPFATAKFNAKPGEVFELTGEILEDLLSAGLVAEEKSEKKAAKKGEKK